MTGIEVRGTPASGQVRSKSAGSEERAPLEPYVYYESPQRVVDGAPRILLISHTFPPDPEVGGLRWQQMARYFGERGWTFDVLTRDLRSLASPDHARLDSLPPGTRVICVPAGIPPMLRFQQSALAGWRWLRSPRRSSDPASHDRDGSAAVERLNRPPAVMRAYFAWMAFLRDAKWAEAVAVAGSRLASLRSYRVVISSGPPHMAHEGARLVAHAARLPYVVDMRDPWSLVQRVHDDHASPVWFALARRYERRVVREAVLVVMNTELSRDAMKATYGDCSGKIVAIRNGCDDEPLPAVQKTAHFSIRFAGSIYIDRDPRLVFRAAARVISTLGLQPSQFKIEFIGDVDRFAGTPTMQIAREEGIERYVTIGGLVKRHAALVFLAGASVLLSLPQDSDFAIPAKIYEYLRFDAWMLVLAHEHSATAQLLRHVDADVVEPEDVDGIASAIRHRYEQFARGERPRAGGTDGQFDRRVQAEKLISLIEDIVHYDR